MMDAATFQQVKKDLVYAMGHERLLAREKELWERVDVECTPQQKAAVTRAVRVRTQELDDLDLRSDL